MKLLNLVLKQQKFVLQETENCALNEVHKTNYLMSHKEFKQFVRDLFA